MLSVLSAAIRCPCLQFSFPRHLVCTLCQQPKHTLRNTQRWGAYHSEAMVILRCRRKVMGLSGAASFLVEETANTPNAVSSTKLIKRVRWMLIFCECSFSCFLSNQDQHLCWKNIVSRFGLLWRQGGFGAADGQAERFAASPGGCQWKRQLGGGTHSLSAGEGLRLWVGPLALFFFGYVWVQACPPAGSCNVAKGRCECVMASACLFNLRLHSLQLSFHLGFILGKLGNPLGDFTKDPKNDTFFRIRLVLRWPDLTHTS